MPYTMKQVCDQLDITYETLRFYCDEGLVPNLKRDQNNYRMFDERNLAWLQSLLCLRRCGMSIKDMKEYMQLCLEGRKSINTRKEILSHQEANLQKQIDELQGSIDYIQKKLQLYDDILAGKVKYHSNLIDEDEI